MSRNLTLDWLKIVVAFMVVGIHSGFLNEFNEKFYFVVHNSILSLAVPIFFLINGFYFTQINSTNIKKWTIRLLILYVVWMLIYFQFWIFYPDGGIRKIPVLIMFITFGYGHLWFIIASLFAGIFLFILKKVQDKYIVYIAVSLYVLGILFQYMHLYKLYGHPSIEYLFDVLPMYRNFLLFAFPYFYIGYYISKYEIVNEVSRTKSFLILIVGLILIIGESLINYNINNNARLELLVFLPIPVVGLFLLVSKFYIPTNSKSIAYYSTGIYLVHLMLLNIYEDTIGLSGTYITIITFILSTIISFFIILINKKIKYLL